MIPTGTLLRFCFICAIAASFHFAPQAQAQTPIVTDSRIKTFVYNENEVFNVVTHYGYQSNIEFGSNESIQTVSVGDRVGWQIVPAGKRLFVRAMEDNAHTNMTVVTNKRAYQFDLREAGQGALLPSEELVYVVRFYYPDEPNMSPPLPLVSAAMMAPQPTVQAAPIAPVSASSGTAPSPVISSNAAAASVNYNYTFSGSGAAAPLKIYDDGASTFFKFSDAGMRPNIAVLSSSNEPLPLVAEPTSDGLVRVNTIASRFRIRAGSSDVVVYNESRPGA